MLYVKHRHSIAECLLLWQRYNKEIIAHLKPLDRIFFGATKQSTGLFLPISCGFSPCETGVSFRVLHNYDK